MSAKHQVIRGLWVGLLLTAMTQPAQAFKLPVRTAPIASITVTPASTTLKVGSTDAMVAVARDHSGHVLSGITFTWSSSNHAAAGINKSTGVASGIGNGTTVITAQAQGVTGKTIVAVSVPHDASGVAATGSPLSNVALTLVDSKGTILTTTTGNDGSYSLDTTGLTPPFLIAVQVDVNTVLYSVSADANVSSTINVDPLTDLIIRSWYGVEGIDMSTAFAHPASDAPPAPATVQIISNVVTDVTALWLQKAGVDTTNFSPISTQFAADGTGVDAVLAESVVDTGDGTITITDGTTNQDSTVSLDTEARSLSVATTTTGPGGTSNSVAGTVIATTSNMQTALSGITATLNAFTGTVNAKGANLKATDLDPYLDTNLLDEGLNKTLFADSTADEFRGLTLSFQVLGITALDTLNGLAAVNFAASGSQGDQTQTETVQFFFKRQSNGTWLFFGNQLPAKLSVQSEMRTNQGFSAPANGPDINVDIRPLTGLYSGITIDGGGVFSNTTVAQGGTELDTFTPDPSSSTTVSVTRDVFFTNTGVLVDLVPAGTSLTVTMTPVSGTPQQFTVLSNAFTTEAISITNLTGTGLTDANLGKDLHVEWTLPATFAIAEVKLSGHVMTSGDVECDADDPVLSNNATAGDVTLPMTCGGNPVTSANINVDVIGVNGERELIIYQFEDTPKD